VIVKFCGVFGVLMGVLAVGPVWAAAPVAEKVARTGSPLETLLILVVLGALGYVVLQSKLADFFKSDSQ